MWNLISNFFTVTLLFGGLLMLYGYLIEPHTVDVTFFKKRHGQRSVATLRIIQISDLHMGYHVSVKSLDHLISQVNALDPDVVVITGDTYDNGEKFPHGDLVAKSLSRLTAHYGKYAIFGNHEYSGNAEEMLKTTMRDSNVTLLVNQVGQVPHPTLRINIAGADCAIYGERRPEFCSELPESEFNLLLLHQADAIKPYLNYPIHIVLSGHTHGGQISFPLIGAPILPEMGKRYLKGWYALTGLVDTELYVNRGFGMTMLPFRFFSKPEITVIDLTPD
mgnify:CR=1 FL=1